MKLASIVCAFAILVATSIVTAATEPPIKVGVSELVRHPKKYHGRRIEVTGYWVTSCAHCSDLYPSFEVEQKKPYGTYVAIGDLRPAKMPFFFRARLTSSLGDYDGYVRVVGTFRFTPVPDWVGKPISPQPKFQRISPPPNQSSSPSEATAERVAVWGWNGGPVKQIVDITDFHPVGRPIPSNIEDFNRRQVENAMHRNPSQN